jgi:hypothetical protein
MKRIVPLLWLAVFCTLCLCPALALTGKQDFVLVNKTGLNIDELYVSPTKSDDWEEDVLGRDVLADGESCEVVFNREETSCRWDLKIVDEDGDEVEWENLNLCEIDKITLYWKNGKAWAEVE